MAKLKQANPTKFYLAKFFFLVLALLQWTVAGTLLLSFEPASKNSSAAFIFICLGSIFIVIFFYLNHTMKRVAVGKNKIVIIDGKKNTRIEWPNVKSIGLIPVFNLYKLQLKNSRRIIYFFPSKNIEPAYDLLAQDTSKMGAIVNKRKKELGI